MDCRDARDKLIDHLEVSPDIQRHIDDCSDCRTFTADLQTLQALRKAPVATPADLKHRTLEQCQAMLGEMTEIRPTSAWQRGRRIFSSPQFIVVAATLGMLILGIIAFYQVNDIQDNLAGLAIKLAVIQIVIQNLLVALFVPILLMLKTNISGAHHILRS